MSHLLNTLSFWIYFLLCVAIKSAGGSREKNDSGFHGIMLFHTAYFQLTTVISLLIAFVAVIVLSIKGEWWYSFVLLGVFFVIAPVAVMIFIEPLSVILGNIRTNIQASRRFYIDINAAREGCGVSIWMLISLLMEHVFSIWMIIEFFR